MKSVILYEWTCGDSVLKKYGYTKKQEVPYDKLSDIIERFMGDGVQVMLLPSEDQIVLMIDDRRFHQR